MAGQAEEAVELLQDLLDRLKAPAQAELAGAGAVFLLRVLAAATKFPKELARAETMVRELMEKWASKKHSSIKPTVFVRLFERHPSIAWRLSEAAAGIAKDEVCAFPFEA